MSKIRKLTALEILDSRGRPTVQVTCELVGGERATAQVPSGASTGSAEACELRDGDPRRHAGLGCRRAVQNVNGPIAEHLENRGPFDQRQLDQHLIELDATTDKSRLGANAILGTSLAFARAAAIESSLPLYAYFAKLIDAPTSQVPRLPQLTINLFSGGKHAGGQVPVQDLLLVPVSATTVDEGLNQVCAVYRAAVEVMKKKYGARWLTADEGGLAPPFSTLDAMFHDALDAIELADLRAGEDIALAIDVASSHFFENGIYDIGGQSLSPPQMIDQVKRWVESYPLISVEDGLAEDDWEHWPVLYEALKSKSRTVGDDLLCTNPTRIQRAIESNACDTLLLKVNQIGTLTEAAQALKMAREAGWHVTVSARSGETEDNWLADLAVGWQAEQIKVGSVTQSERLAKYNRLLAIEAELSELDGHRTV